MFSPPDSSCTCELDGWCTPCRQPFDLTAPLAELGTQQCVWCKCVYRQANMFRFGKNKWNKWVCGPDCPLRPRKGKIWKRRNMTANKKLYELLAYDLVITMALMPFGQYEALVNRVGRSLASDNPNFDWEIWLRATGIAKGK